MSSNNVIHHWKEWNKNPRFLTEIGTTQDLATIEELGFSLQHYIQRKDWHNAESCATNLDHISTQPKPAGTWAAYFLWPWHAHRYYIGGTGLDAQLRLDSRAKLCKLLKKFAARKEHVSNDFKSRFPETEIEDAFKTHFQGVARKEWHAPALIDETPDLFAIDHFVHLLLSIPQSLPEAVNQLYSLAGTGDPADHQLRTAVRDAFLKFQIAQVTFLRPRHPPSQTHPRFTEITAYNIPHLAHEFAELLPFHCPQGTTEVHLPDPVAAAFRALVTAIHSAESSAKPHFAEGSRAYRTKLGFFMLSDGATSFSTIKAQRFLSLDSPGFATLLEDLRGAFDPPDWGDATWWTTKLKLDDQLLGAQQNRVNCHYWALWDQVVPKAKRFPDSAGSLVPLAKQLASECIQSGELVGALPDALLRIRKKGDDLDIEPWSRTPFFLLLDAQEGEAATFVGGTFQALEVPGLPFDDGALAKLLETNVSAMMQTLNRYIAKRIDVDAQARRKAETIVPRAQSIVQLLNIHSPPFYEEHHLTSWDHPITKQLHTIGVQLHTSSARLSDCESSLKASLSFPQHQSSPEQTHWSGAARYELLCGECVSLLLNFLLNDTAPAVVVVRPAVRLPSLPGIRFLILLAHFLTELRKHSTTPKLEARELRFDQVLLPSPADKPAFDRLQVTLSCSDHLDSVKTATARMHRFENSIRNAFYAHSSEPGRLVRALRALQSGDLAPIKIPDCPEILTREDGYRDIAVPWPRRYSPARENETTLDLLWQHDD